jgi:hypothetical protein
MRQLFFIVAFWIVVVVAMRLAVSFPRSLLARVFFTPFGPEPLRGEARPEYLLRCARFGASWFAQAIALFAGGWIALEWHPALADSLFFLVLWAAVIPLLGTAALIVSLYALGRCFWIRTFGRTLTRVQS